MILFGYVVTNQPELKIREFETYRSYYCGLCRSLKKRYGLAGRLTLNYDMTFLVMVLTSLYEPEVTCCEHRCLAHGCMKQKERISEVGDYAADMNVLLAYHNCMDDWNDDRNILKRAYAGILKRKLRKRGIFDKKAETIEGYLNELSELEKAKCSDVEKMAAVFGNVMAELFSMKDDMWKENLSKCGFHLGKFIYVLDAYDDYEDDKKKGSFNPLIELGEGYETKADTLLTISAARAAEYFERLPLIDDIEIMRNILYAGIWTGYERVKEKRDNGSV